jgi:hypothetical protein
VSKRLVTFSAWLCVALVVCVALTQIARLYPAEAVLAFNPAGCELPCVLGIRPGVTAKAEAQRLLDENTFARDIGDYNLQYQLNGDPAKQPYLSVSYRFPDALNTVTRLRVAATYPNHLTTLGKLLAAGFRVERVFRSNVVTVSLNRYGSQWAASTVSYHYSVLLTTPGDSAHLIAVVFVVGQLEPRSLVSDIYVVDGPFPADVLRDVRGRWNGADDLRWVGLASLRRYQREAVLPPMSITLNP